MTSSRLKMLLVCSQCGESFHPLNGRAKTMRFCSTSCRDEAATRPLRDMSAEECAWLAGLFDGEGHIGIGRQLSQRSRGVKIQITNTNRELLEEVQRVTGVGYITTRYRESEKHRPTHDWYTSGRNARRILDVISPRLIVKRDKAREAIA